MFRPQNAQSGAENVLNDVSTKSSESRAETLKKQFSRKKLKSNFIVGKKSSHLKVVIPSINCRHKKMVFSTPRDEFWIS